MLRQNFKVGYQVLNSVTKGFSIPFRNNVNSNKFIQRQINKTYPTSEQYKKKLKQYLKSSFRVNYRKLFFKSKLGKATAASDDYLNARQSLKLRIGDTIKFVENESRLITSNLNDRLENNKATRTAQLKKLSQRITRKLDKLTCLDVSYGCCMRNKTLLLDDEIRRSFDLDLEQTIVANVKQIMSMLKDLQNDVSTCVKRAEKHVISCRDKHVVPVEFAECVNERLDEATLMLDIMNKQARLKLAEIVKFSETVMRAHEITAQELMELNCKKSAELSKYLERCIVKLKRASK